MKKDTVDLESEQSVTVLDAVGSYMSSLRKKNVNPQAQKELLRFAKWCGHEKMISDVRPPDIGAYGEQTVGTVGGSEVSERLQEVRKFLAFARKNGMIEKNLATHLRIRKTHKSAVQASKGQERNLIELTPAAHRKLEVDLEKLKAQRGPIATVIRQAAADQDIRENAPLEAAREQLGYVESRITEIEMKLRSAVVVNPSKRRGKAVAVGSTVLLEDLDAGRKTRYTLVTAFESNPLEGKISDVSPVGKALVGRTAGQDIQVDTPRGTLGYRVVRVS